MRSNLLALIVVFPLFLSSVATPVWGASAKEQVFTTVEGACNAWKQKNRPKMYSFLSDHDQKKIPFNAFEKKRRTLAIMEKLVKCRIIKTKIDQPYEASVSIELLMLKGPQAQFFPAKKGSQKRTRLSGI